MKLWRCALPLLAAGALIVAACGGDDDDNADNTPTTGSGADGAQTVTVQVDGDGPDYDAFMIAYFPDEITLHPGDTVRFKLEDTGEPHTVSAGDPLDAIFDFVYNYCGPEGFAAAKCAEDAETPPDIEAQFNTLFEKFPSMLPEGPGDANQGPANPCFMATGEMALDTPCPEVDQPDFSGTQSWYSSGWLGGDEDFVVKLADDLAPGTYRFLCLLHGPEMIETINVVAESADADTADEVQARLDEQLAAAQLELAQPAADVKAFAGSNEGGMQIDVLTGAFSETKPFGVAEFGPAEISIPVGGSVTWGDISGHTISFNTEESSKSLRVVADDSTIHLNEAALAPAGIPEVPASEEPPAEGEDGAPPEEQGPPPLIDGGTWNGQGALTTGFGEGMFKLTFSEAGTYEYKCLVHDGMEGTVKVGE